MQPRNRPALYEERLVCLWQRLAATLGIHTARVLLHCALRQTAHVLNAHGYHTAVQERWWIMPAPVPKQPWEVRIAYKKGWEVRMAYYDSLLHGVMEMIEGTMKIMKVDGMSEAVEDLGKALLAIEDAWDTLALEKSSSLVARERTTCN